MTRKNKDSGDGDGDKPKNNNIENKPNLNFNKYINEALYPLIKQHHNISPSNVNHIDIIGDRNCLFRSISRFIYVVEDLHERVRNEIYNEALRRINDEKDNIICYTYIRY